MLAPKTLPIVLLLSAASLFPADRAFAKGKQPDAPPRTSPSFSELDKDMDGRLTLEEFKAGFPAAADLEKKFKSLDADGDGTLSMGEYKAAYPDPMPRKKAAKKSAKPARKLAAKDAAKPKPARKRFALLDTNQDGRISLDEFKSGNPTDPAPEKTFRALDSDGDGFLSRAEYNAGQPKAAKNK